jgi:hypothetical protein
MAIDPTNYPHLLPEGFKNSSCMDSAYNCIAWAVAADVENWWWPPGGNGSYWPPELSSRDVSVATFTEMFISKGFEECQDDNYEEGYEKIALYTNGGIPTHAARQLPSGQWTHKIGQNVDIETSLKGVQDSKTGYGRATKFFRKQLG